MKKQTALFFYIIAGYIILQFTWWAYHLIEVTSSVNTPEMQKKQFIMIVGEGLVFFLLLLLGLWKIRNSIQKEIVVSKRQNNFLLSITHELKTPLASNKLYLQTLLKRTNLDRARQEELIIQAIAENKRLEEMIANILTATQIDTNELQTNFEEVNFGNEITRIVNKWSDNRIAVELNIDTNITTKVDIFIIEAVLHNLLENAYKYAGKNPKIEVYLLKENNKIVWGVRDNGAGISLENRKDIFNRFVRIGNEETRAQKGTGLGLYIVKNLLLIHGDDIQYHDNIPHGADFKISRIN